ncbi:AraC family transcriptional regulator [Microbacterium sp. JB110]|nr:AraC family transcriptional regulator [Microbacterium sp. JB110]
MRVLTRLRAEKFAELLHMTGWSVQRCSEAVGWPDASHAARMMKRIYGLTPTQYRTAARARPHL